MDRGTELVKGFWTVTPSRSQAGVSNCRAAKNALVVSINRRQQSLEVRKISWIQRWCLARKSELSGSQFCPVLTIELQGPIPCPSIRNGPKVSYHSAGCLSGWKRRNAQDASSLPLPLPVLATRDPSQAAILSESQPSSSHFLKIFFTTTAPFSPKQPCQPTASRKFYGDFRLPPSSFQFCFSPLRQLFDHSPLRLS